MPARHQEKYATWDKIQDTEHCTPEKGVMHTAIAGMGLMYSWCHQRFAVPTELLVANGWPATDEFSAATGGATCTLHPSEGPGPPQCTRASILRQLGNAQRVTSVGVWTLFVALTLDRLGMRLQPASQPVQEDRGIAAAFRKRRCREAGIDLA